MAKVRIKDYPAVGGPEIAGTDKQGFEAGPTDAGEYRVAYVGKHESRRYPEWSRVLWGTPLRKQKIDDKDVLQVQVNGTWKKLSELTPVTEAQIVEYYEFLYGTRRVPDAWVFNDFGHLTVYLYVDKNRDGKRDAKTEPVHGEFIHTTPVDEANTALKRPVVLAESHGCVHVQPQDIDEMAKRGYLRKNTQVTVHPYHDRIVRFDRAINANPPWELHFYPGIKQFSVIGNVVK